MQAGHGPNIGHGWVKYVIIDRDGCELPPVSFPALVARAHGTVAGAITRAATVTLDERDYWIGSDALLSPAPITMLAQDRLRDPLFIPALVRGAVDQFGRLNGSAGGVCVSGLPASWAGDPEKARALGERLRGGHPFGRVRVIPEPLGIVYAAALDNNGAVTHGDLLAQRVAIVDIGHLTVDIAVVNRLIPEPASLETFTLGTAQPLRQIRTQLGAHFERELSLYETDLAVRRQSLEVAGQPRPLPHGWDRPLLESGSGIAARLVEAWGSGNQFAAILIGGGGAELAPLTAAICRRFPQATVVDQPQTAIARGYARLARRFACESAS